MNDKHTDSDSPNRRDDAHSAEAFMHAAGEHAKVGPGRKKVPGVPHRGDTLPPPSKDEDEPLVASLQRAFEYYVDVLAAPDSCWLSRDDGSFSAVTGTHDVAALPSGTQLGDFEIVQELGRGGMGIVYHARQLSLRRDVALKVLPGYAKHGQEAIQRFKTEARAAARLHHTNIVSIYAEGEHDGQHYYVMELIDGTSLDRVIRAHPELLMAPDRKIGSESGNAVAAGSKGLRTLQDYRHLATCFAEVADALHYAHEHGVIHRDVKPHNLMLGKTCQLHVTDFGLARLAEEPHLTVTGDFLGTPAYLSPEQIRGTDGDIDARTDIFSLGVTLYETLTGAKPFRGETRDQITTRICSEEPEAPRKLVGNLPADLETICLRAMEKSPQRRHATAALLAEDLRRFGQGRTILSRRAGPIERGIKWVRRHKVGATVVAAVVAVAIIAGGAAIRVRSAHRHQADVLLTKAYDQLAYFDYHTFERVEEDLTRAEQLGGDAVALHRARALAAMGAVDMPRAIAHLEQALSVGSHDLPGWYMLAWAQWRNGDRAAAVVTLDHAESLQAEGVAMSADAWFFRGLAIHYLNPAAAIESYRIATAMRSGKHEFYPQAVLHLARARNQQLYATRSLEGLAEAQRSLQQLIDNGYHGAYPHYLLSITHRLAAEIYEGSQGTRDDSLVASHYDKALHFARLGQELNPANDRPITAEAECLERMGLLADAIAARDRAIDVASTDAARFEGYHYRWRLHYWTGDYEAALADLATDAGFEPDSPFYVHVYPALVLADQGDMSSALHHARTIAAEAPDRPTAVIWSATCLRLLGAGEEADDLLNRSIADLDYEADASGQRSAVWLKSLYRFCQSGRGMDELEKLAHDTPAPWRLWGEAAFYDAAIRLAQGDRPGALASFGRAYRSFDGEQRYTYHARVILVRMQRDPAWPGWLPANRGAATTPTAHVP